MTQIGRTRDTHLSNVIDYGSKMCRMCTEVVGKVENSDGKVKG